MRYPTKPLPKPDPKTAAVVKTVTPEKSSASGPVIQIDFPFVSDADYEKELESRGGGGGLATAPVADQWRRSAEDRELLGGADYEKEPSIRDHQDSPIAVTGKKADLLSLSDAPQSDREGWNSAALSGVDGDGVPVVVNTEHSSGDESNSEGWNEGETLDDVDDMAAEIEPGPSAGPAKVLPAKPTVGPADAQQARVHPASVPGPPSLAEPQPPGDSISFEDIDDLL